ncbi:GDP-L-galactose phosphorylase 1 [Raphanus sativus]|nr:GDP-L-galactose phosphorylase 1 [Raphanus sativus]
MEKEAAWGKTFSRLTTLSWCRKRVLTVVSNYQKDEASDESVGCGRNCLGACCINGARLPLYVCQKLEKSCAGEKPVAFLESLVLGEVIPGKYGFVAQLNEGRDLKKRPTEFRVDKVLPLPGHAFPLEKAPSMKMITTASGVKISELLSYPVRSLFFEGGSSMQDLSDTVSDACVCLQNNNIPFNILIADCGRQIFLMPHV